MTANYYAHGQWNVICDSCGFKRKSSEVRKRWDGLIVCADTCWETDHPQKYLRVRETGLAVDPIRNEPVDTFIRVCYIFESASYSGLASSGCMRSGITSPSYLFLLALKKDGPENS